MKSFQIEDLKEAWRFGFLEGLSADRAEIAIEVLEKKLTFYEWFEISYCSKESKDESTDEGVDRKLMADDEVRDWIIEDDKGVDEDKRMTEKEAMTYILKHGGRAFQVKNCETC